MLCLLPSFDKSSSLEINEQLREERETKLKEQELKTSQFAATTRLVDEIKEQKSLSAEVASAKLIEAARDELGALLDSENGSSIDDKEVC